MSIETEVLKHGPKDIVDIVNDLARKTEKDGFMLDENGSFIRVGTIKEHDLEKDKLVRTMSRDAVVIHDEMRALKQKFALMMEKHIEHMGELYNVKIGGKKGNVSLTSFDKRLKIERTKQDRMTTNEHMLIATQLVDECLEGWSKGSNKNLQAFVRKYFRTDAKGNYSIADLQRVRKLELERPDPLWDKAMKALDNAIEHDFTATYFRAFYRDDAGAYHAIPLDFAKI